VSGTARFYKDVTVASADGGFAVQLDGCALKTPGGSTLIVPTQALAEAIAEEWREQGETLRHDTMLLTKLANTAIDRVRPNRPLAAEQIVGFARSDLVCYRADAPCELVARQDAQWDPLIDWARTHHGVALKTATGIGFVTQEAEALAALEARLAAYDDFALAALHAAAALMGSAVIALALAGGRLGAEDAFAAAELDRIYQTETWGMDAEAEGAARIRRAELLEIARFFKLLLREVYSPPRGQN
jgi:chaperone required for assembly of F1-ATPase